MKSINSVQELVDELVCILLAVVGQQCFSCPAFSQFLVRTLSTSRATSALSAQLMAQPTQRWRACNAESHPSYCWPASHHQAMRCCCPQPPVAAICNSALLPACPGCRLMLVTSWSLLTFTANGVEPAGRCTPRLVTSNTTDCSHNNDPWMHGIGLSWDT